MTTIELVGLEVFGHHGAYEDERAEGRTFLFDVSFELPHASDELDRTVDYDDVAACVREVSDSRQFRLIEALAGAVADALLERFGVEHVTVRVRKPHLNLPVRHSAATVTRTRTP